MSDEQPQVPELPAYPQGVPVANKSQAKPLIKMVSRLLKPRMRMPKVGKVSDQDVHIAHKKKVKYW